MARASYAASRAAAAGLPGSLGRNLVARADAGFLDGLHAGCAVAAGVCLFGALVVVAYLPAHPVLDDVEPVVGQGSAPRPS